MTDNVYRAPAADLTLPESEPAQYYRVARFKLLLLYAGTLGMYSYYWFYRHWKQIRLDGGESLWPIPRAIFSIFFAHALFVRFDRALRARTDDVEWSPRTLASCYVIFEILGNLSDRLPLLGLGLTWVLLAILASLLVIGYVLVRAQAVANIACGDADGAGNARITPANLVWILIGPLFLVAVFALELGLLDLPA